jgi:integration host factor subunit beta
MTKAELVEEVARAAELTKKDSEVIVDEVFKNIIQALNRGEKIELRGFGSFRVRQRDARRGRNPKTGAPVDIPAKRVPYFKPGKELKELINAGNEGAVDDDIDDIDEMDDDAGEDNGAEMNDARVGVSGAKANADDDATRDTGTNPDKSAE